MTGRISGGIRRAYKYTYEGKSTKQKKTEPSFSRANTCKSGRTLDGYNEGNSHTYIRIYASCQPGRIDEEERRNREGAAAIRTLASNPQSSQMSRSSWQTLFIFVKSTNNEYHALTSLSIRPNGKEGAAKRTLAKVQSSQQWRCHDS